MEKPVTVALDDLRKSVWKTINEVRLPATILEPVIADIHGELSSAARQELTFDRKTYEESLKKEAEEAKKNENKEKFKH